MASRTRTSKAALTTRNRKAHEASPAWSPPLDVLGEGPSYAEYDSAPERALESFADRLRMLAMRSASEPTGGWAPTHAGCGGSAQGLVLVRLRPHRIGYRRPPAADAGGYLRTLLSY
jgi:hypothetical protein